MHGRIDAATVIWAAGVIASPAAGWLAAEHDRAGRVKVGPDLSVPRPSENISSIGDTAAVMTPPGSRSLALRPPPSRWDTMWGG